MKVVEILKLGWNFLELLQKSSVKMDDLRYVALYDEYKKIVGNGGKSTYAAVVLSQKYGISERKVYYVIKKLDAECAKIVQ